MTRDLPKLFDQPESTFHRDVPAMSVFLTPANVLFPLKTGDKIFMNAFDAELNEKMQAS